MSRISFRLFLILTFGLTGTQIKASEGGWTSGGGDTVAMEFVSLGYRVHDMLAGIENMNRTDALKGLVDLPALKTKLQTAKIESSDERLEVNGAEVDAINYPSQNRIVISRPRWMLYKPTETRAGLVLHEYLGLQLKDARYMISSKVAARIKVDPFGMLEEFSLSCEVIDEHPTMGKIHVDLFNIGEHYAWAKFNFTGRSSDQEVMENKMLRERGNGTDEFSFAGSRGSVYLELNYAQIWDPAKSFITLVFLNDGDRRAVVFDSLVSCTKK